MNIFQIEAIECIKNIENQIECLRQTVAMKNTFQNGYIENCKKHIASYEAQIEFLKKKYNV